MLIPVGQFIANRYEVLAALVPGGQGDVYRVLDHYENAVGVLKLLNPATLTAGLWDEAQILRQLADDHILPIRNADVFAGQPFIVTALAEHGTLETTLAATSGVGLDADRVVTWIRQASIGVARGHDASLVHNDIKPGNLFLTANNECLVGDFGLASVVPPPPIPSFWPQPTSPRGRVPAEHSKNSPRCTGSRSMPSSAGKAMPYTMPRTSHRHSSPA